MERSTHCCVLSRPDLECMREVRWEVTGVSDSHRAPGSDMSADSRKDGDLARPASASHAMRLMLRTKAVGGPDCDATCATC